jgi:arylsulfatase A-like enzyme
VPQICCWPGRIEPGRITDQVTITMDLTSTCLSATGVAPAPGYPLNGVDLLLVLTGRRRNSNARSIGGMRHRYQRAVRRGDWKYLKVADNEYLFDIAYDPRERGDLSQKEPHLLADLRDLWEDWDRNMLALPTDAVVPMSNLSAMLW